MKRKAILHKLILIILMFGWIGLFAQEKISERPKVALVLGGGGAKGFSHIGVLKVLEKEGIPIDMVVGTSIGSVVGGIYAMGYSADSIEHLSKEQDWNALFSDKVMRLYYSQHKQLIDQRYALSIPMEDGSLSFPKAAISGHKLTNFFCSLSTEYSDNISFDSLSVPFASVATNIETGEKVVIRKGFLPVAMYASMAIPGVFAPADYDNKLLIDGGVVDNFPVEVAKEMGADIIIGVDIRNSLADKEHLKSIPKVINQLISFYDPRGDSLKYKSCDIVITPDISGFSSASFKPEAVDSLVKRGEQAAMENIEALRIIKQAFKLSEKPQIEPNSLSLNRWLIRDVVFDSEPSLSKATILKNMQLEFPNNYSYEEINIAVNKLYGRENFEKIYFSLEEPAKGLEGKLLKLYLFEKKTYTQNVGFKVNTTDAAAILVNLDRSDNTKSLKLWSVSAELSTNPGLSLLGEMKLKNFSDLGLKLDAKRQNYSVYDYKEKIGSADLYYTSGTMYLYRNFFHMMNMGLSMSLEYFRGDIYLEEAAQNGQKIESENLLLDSRFYISFDNLDNFYFPKRGLSFYTDLSLLRNYYSNTGVTVPVYMFKGQSVVSLTDKMALIGEAYSRSVYGGESSLYKNTFVGGEAYSVYFNNQFPFVGMNAITQVGRYSNIARISSRYNFIRKHYIGVKVNVLRSADELMDFTNCVYVWGVGISYQIKTNLGPFDLTVGYSDYQKLPSISANLGYWF